MLIRYRLSLTPHHDKNGRCRVRVRISMPTQGRVTFWLPFSVSAKWDKDSEKILGNTTEAKTANNVISEFKIAVSELFGRYELIEKRVPLLSEVRDELGEYLSGVPSRSQFELKVCDVFPVFVQHQGRRNNWQDATHTKFSALAKHVKEFNAGLKLCDVDDRVMYELYLYMLNVLNFKNTTIDKQLALFRWFLRWCANNGYYSGNSHETFHPRIKGVSVSSREIIYCTREELQQLMDFKFNNEQRTLEIVRDGFVFCCFTGLRYSDLAKLRRCDIGDNYISVLTQKTSDALRIELNKYSAQILAKYRDCQAQPTSNAIPVISNVKMNARLKELGKIVGLNNLTRVVSFHGNERIENFLPKYELLTTHCARRTFVVTALQLGIAPEVIMRWTGHSSYDAMKPYVAIVDELKRRSMDKFDLF